MLLTVDLLIVILLIMPFLLYIVSLIVILRQRHEKAGCTRRPWDHEGDFVPKQRYTPIAPGWRAFAILFTFEVFMIVWFLLREDAAACDEFCDDPFSFVGALIAGGIACYVAFGLQNVMRQMSASRSESQKTECQ